MTTKPYDFGDEQVQFEVGGKDYNPITDKKELVNAGFFNRSKGENCLSKFYAYYFTATYVVRSMPRPNGQPVSYNCIVAFLMEEKNGKWIPNGRKAVISLKNLTQVHQRYVGEEGLNLENSGTQLPVTPFSESPLPPITVIENEVEHKLFIPNGEIETVKPRYVDGVKVYSNVDGSRLPARPVATFERLDNVFSDELVEQLERIANLKEQG